MSKIVLPILLLLLSFLFIGYKFLPSVHTTNTIEKDSIVTIRIAVTGDLMCHAPQFKSSTIFRDSFDFSPSFKYIKQYLQDADFTIGNLETITAGKNKKYSGYPFFNSPDQYIRDVKNAGFGFVTTSNNHALDRGEAGIRRTIEKLVQSNLDYTGTFTSQKDRDSIRIINIKGIKTALLSYSYGTNGNPIPLGKKYLINLINEKLIRKDISNARKSGAELIVVYYHFGQEYKREPVQSQIDLVNKTKQLGADIILGGHPHVIEPMDYFKTLNAKLDTGFVIYSLGNFFSAQRWRYSDAGVILYLNISKNLRNDSLWISSVDFIPTWVYKGYSDNGNHYIILPAKDYMNYPFLKESDKIKMKQALNDTRYILSLKYVSPF
jgi:poly-gamma-glutamate synthesis protein (capsule biosynthesis protein)